MIPSPITLIGLGITGIFFGGGIIPIRVIVPHHFFRFPCDLCPLKPSGEKNQVSVILSANHSLKGFRAGGTETGFFKTLRTLRGMRICL
jgi:hypothetical protein